MKKPNEMKFTQLLSRIIVEDSRTEFLHDKYVHEPKKGEKGKPKEKTIPFEVFKEIVRTDPSTKFPDGFDFDTATYEDIKNKVNAGGYTEWIIKSLFKLTPDNKDLRPGSPEYNKEMQEKIRLFMEDLFKINGDLVKFIKYKPYLPQDKRDINKFSSPNDLFMFLQSFQLPEKKQKELEKKKLKKEIRKEREGYKHPGAQTVFNGDTWTVVKIEGDTPESREAASWYGGFYDYDNGESRWCTSPPNSNYFRSYITKGPLYVILANDDKGKVGGRTGLPQERYQWHFEDEQFMDRADHQIDLIKFLTGEGAELKEYFKPMFLSGKGGKESADATSVELKLSSRKGKIIAIYGFDEFFDNLSPNLEKLSIDNDTNNDVAIDIPESIGNLRKLRSLNLKKCVKSIPDSICNCNELFALTISNSKEIKTLPECLRSIKEFEFFHAKDCPNLKLPKIFSNPDLWDNVGPGIYFLRDNK